MPLEIVVTNAGRAALVNAQNNGTNPVAITEVGLSSTAVVPLPTLTALAGEFKRVAAVSGEVVADDTIHLSVMDSSGDSYTLRSIGLYLADGTLFAIYGQVAAVLEKTASSDAALSVDVIFADISAALLTFGDASFLNPPATTERQGVVELATVAEARLGIDALRALTPAAANAAILGWLLAQDGAGSGIDSDLLDGQHGSYYTNIIARLGFTPVNKAGDIMTGLLTLSGAPTGNLHASTKQYVDGLVTAAALLAKMLTVDGAGSGIDADLLDGQHGAYYLTASSYTAADVRAKLLTVDGAGSGIDADMLDGQQASYYTAIAARLGYNPVQQGTGFGQGTNPVKIGWKVGARLGLTVDTVDLGNFVLDSNITDVWRSSNDGAGSGLDADLLDGRQGNAYALLDGTAAFTGSIKASDANALLMHPGGNVPTVIHRTDGANYYIMISGASGSHNGIWNTRRPLQIDLNTGLISSQNGQVFSGGTNVSGLFRHDGRDVVSLQSVDGNPAFGYRVYADGFKHMWGTNSYAGDQNKTINFPFAFSSWAHTFLEGGVNSNGQQENGPFVLSSTIHGFTGLNAANASVPVMWHAFGY